MSACRLEKRKIRASQASKGEPGTEEQQQPALGSSVLGDLSRSAAKKKTKKGRGTAVTVVGDNDDLVVDIGDCDDEVKKGAKNVNIGFILWGKAQKVQLAGVRALVSFVLAARARPPDHVVLSFVFRRKVISLRSVSACVRFPSALTPHLAASWQQCATPH
jgi:hypothetical protein